MQLSADKIQELQNYVNTLRIELVEAMLAKQHSRQRGFQETASNVDYDEIIEAIKGRLRKYTLQK